MPNTATSTKWPAGVLYLRRHPLLAFDLLYEQTVRDLLVFRSLMRGATQVAALREDYPFSETGMFEEPGYPCMYFVENNSSYDPTNWWIPKRACAEAMLRSAGFEDVRNSTLAIGCPPQKAYAKAPAKKILSSAEIAL